MDWRLIPTQTHTAALNMALDEACLQEVANGNSAPTIRFYRWQPSAISIGYFQNLTREVDLNECAKQGIDIVRRQTGGGAVFHSFEGELTYSIIAPSNLFPANIIESYKEICGYLINGFTKLGIQTTFKPINDIITDAGKKISGNAQLRRQGVLLQHGTILTTVDVKKMFSLLKVPDEKIRDKMIQTVEERVTSIQATNPNLTFEQIESAFIESFTANKKYTMESFSDPELKTANNLAKDKYQDRDWNFLR